MINKMQGKLNTFQKTILLWNNLHPYNAVHVVRVPKLLDVQLLKDIIDNHLENCGLANLAIDHKKKRFHYNGGPSDAEIKVLVKTQDTFTALCGEIEEQLNKPFAGDGKIIPFRFFVFAEESSFYLGLVYFHLIAGADSIIAFLKSVTEFYLEGKKTGPYPYFNLYPVTYKYLLPSHLKYLPAWILTLPGHIANLRKSFRPLYRNIHDSSTGFSCFHIKPQQFYSFMETVKKWNVTINDMFLALLLKSIAPLASERFHEQRRKKISVASIINIRKDLSVTNPECFGVFLSSFNVSHSVPEDLPFEQLVKDIHIQTEKIKKKRLYLRTIMEMRTAIFLISFFFKKRQKTFYSKYHPLWGGVTNINLNTLWAQPGNKIPVDYFRAVATGHATPLVFSFTTVNDNINIGVSFRKTVFSSADIERIISAFSRLINNLSG